MDYIYTDSQQKIADLSDVEVDVSLLAPLGAPVEDNSIWYALGLVPDEFDLEAVQ